MRRKILISLLAMVLVVMLGACATGTKGKLVSSYELAGVTLKTAYNVAKPACDANQLPADKCVQIKKIYNDTRASYLLAGDSLIIAVEVDDLVKKQAALQEYQNLATQFTKNTTDLINLLVQLGVIKSK
jgi:hypothetical protein